VALQPLIGRGPRWGGAAPPLVELVIVPSLERCAHALDGGVEIAEVDAFNSTATTPPPVFLGLRGQYPVGV